MLVPGLDEARAARWGREFGQTTVVVGRIAEPVRLIWCEREPPEPKPHDGPARRRPHQCEEWRAWTGCAARTYHGWMTTDAHARPSGDAPEPLYDVNVATPTHAERARTLAAAMSIGTLCTLALEPEGYPYGSFVTVAFDAAGDPVFLVSTLAEHTRNLQRDPRASLLVAEGGAADPLANGRVTLLGPCRRVQDDDGARRAFLAVHPNAAYYADFRDFAFWKLQVQSVRYIGGYGRMSWVSEAEWRAAEPDPLGPSAAGIISHMNDDHADALALYCRAFSKATDIAGATMTGVDRYGFEMSAKTPEGPRPVRLAFAQPVATADEVRAALVRMVKEARARLG